ncbi:hypothetical protein NNA36_06645 [Shimia sp. CNT1-13L.2]|uniref:hypothetical protein n=1 Tax=Shimia sp. CNT1-13L.2 TaxID=2959663 RepID=UPI0020CDE64F|nr:hypothetical protein [Shimia sp. CNT1-13L.2]MCP9481639.1 hypothetical protein [Shimia sp. CNT1-13L.2]
MVTNNKVLTVSYGTFSCTLEGFDDSFDTMKAIAEYFRDLAADDRYFGAEPPTPDAEMLARIAEREVERRVQARTEQGSIYLTTEAPAAPAPQPEAAPAPVAQAAPVEVAEPQAESPEEQIEPEVEDVTDEILDAVTAPETEMVEETIEEVVAEDIVEDAPVAEAIADQDATIVADLEGALEEQDFADDEVASAPAQDDTLDLSAIEDALAEEDAAEDIAELVEEPEDFPAEENSIAAKLQRIRAVVSKSRNEPEEEDYSEDEHADSFLTEAREEIESVLKLDDEMAAAAAEEDVAEEPAEQEIVAEAPVERPVRARVVRMKKADFEEAVSAGLLEAEPEEDEPEAPIAEDTAETKTDEPGRVSSLTPEDEAELLAELAQVEAELNRADQMEAEEEPEADRSERGKHLTDADRDAESDMPRLMAEADQHMNEPDGNRRRQAIAHLRAAVAATKAEQRSGAARAPQDATEPYRGDLASVVRNVTGQAPEETEVRPSRPKAPAAPLKLVAEQRVDTPAAEPQEPAAPVEAAPAPEAEAPRSPVRPRRVSVGERAADAPAPAPAAPSQMDPAEAGSFAEFAESMGATKLPEVLEAAAAYLTFVEGQDKFSRPMVMRLARDVDGSNAYTREDSLRSFGQLLRENKIAKIEGGRFTASELIGYRPEDRAAG